MNILKNREQSAAVVEPKQTEVGEPFGGWRFVVEEHVVMGAPEFWVVRIGIHENVRRGRRVLAACSTFKEAHAIAGEASWRMAVACARY